jgi:hypothetical protein
MDKDGFDKGFSFIKKCLIVGAVIAIAFAFGIGYWIGAS